MTPSKTAGLKGSQGEALILRGSLAELVPLEMQHAEALLAIASEDRQSFALTKVPNTLPAMRVYIAQALSDYEMGRSVPFAIRSHQGNTLIGTSRFCEIEYWAWPEDHLLRRNDGTPDVLRVCWTWLAPTWQGSAAGREARHLMLVHAFTVWTVRRLTIRTDARNQRSRRAIEKIGGQLDGILRCDALSPDGQIRNTATYSILRDDWLQLAVHAELTSRTA